jgi:hypothetical protein
VRTWYPELAVIVGDDAPEEFTCQKEAERFGAQYLRLPLDCGLSAGRNALVQAAVTDYVVLADDDFEFIGDTKLEVLRYCIQEYALDLVGANLIWVAPDKVRMQRHAGLTRIDPNKVYHCEQGKYGDWHFEFEGERQICEQVDIVLNFFLARRLPLLDVPWNENLKFCEHHDFFLDAKGKLRIGHCPYVMALHRVAVNPQYAVFRNRMCQYQHQFMQQRGLTALEFTPLSSWM